MRRFFYVINKYISENFNNILFVLALIVFVLIIFFIFKTQIEKNFKNKAQKSNKYLSIIELNKKYCFHDIKEFYYITKRHKSKQQFQRFDYTKYFEEHVEQNIDFFDSLIQKTQDNINLYEKYLKDINPIINFQTEQSSKSKILSSIYSKIEDKEIHKVILNPIINPCFICSNQYTSPKGRNSYQSEQSYHLAEIIETINKVRQKNEYKETKEYQRKLMSPSLRYDILKRDGFKCTICGRNTEDGAKLHVDHIIPVSKGGKTVPENLRTLCDSCNLGKSDKYDENGLN